MLQQPCRGPNDPAVAAAVHEHGATAEATLPVLRAAQAANHGHLSPRLLGAVADALGVSDAHVHGVATFYSLLSTRPSVANVLRVCDGPVCMLHGAQPCRAAIEAAAAGGGWSVERCSCLGLCDRAPSALRGAEPCGPITPASAGEVLRGRPGEMPSYAEPRPGEVRRVLARVGRIDPDSIDSALEAGAYQALDAALADSPADVLAAVERSGLRGCGGAGFPTGRKWRMAAAGAAPRYVVCNADESEPGSFKDRVLMEGDPHLLLEGLALAGYAVGADQGVIYVRGEYEWVARRLERAVAQAEARGRLGESLRGGFSFRVRVHRGAGAYVAGEETALLESLEGRRAEPRVRPPYPTTHGFHGRPTAVNNVETLCHVPGIVARSPEWFRALGTPHSPGTKLFSVTGHVNRPGVFEAPLGVTLRQVVEQLAGGMRGGARFKAALAGGAAGAFVPAALLDVPVDFSSAVRGVPLGSGALLIMDESASVPEVLSWVLRFFEAESCGKCVPCREGTRELRLLTERIAAGRGRAGDTAELSRLARLVQRTSLCGLGGSVAAPVESALLHFGEEFAAGG
jgi:NADH-quinone oxidoreductase subunit F